jgi:hypothetical protein
MGKLLRKDVLKWIRLLKSGQYRKGTGQLVSNDGRKFCCLGVWADMQGAVWEEQCNSSIPNILVPLKDKLHPEQSYSFIEDPKLANGLDIEIQSKLTEINDNSRGFSKVIKYIEDNVLPKTVK